MRSAASAIALALVAHVAAAQSVARQVLTDPTTYMPAAVTFVAGLGDWTSSQPFFAIGAVEVNPDLTRTGESHAAPLSYGAGLRVIARESLIALGESAAANVGADLLEGLLRRRVPQRAGLWRGLGVAARIGIACAIGYRMAGPHVDQWHANVETWERGR